ncbi:TetR/AcrR family transcriptional regulator [Pseudarthrobacter sp. S9]|uniref:TetR/AcrR family transcriptional regulator n=1 Tax=Pseudarthrobacter sp. S9 TaxID=3418421 RepID=UPI003CFCFB59
MARAGLTADRLARVGAELADEIGFECVTVAAVARHFDVKPASLYSHVQSSADLRTRIALFALEQLADRASEAVAGRAGKDALAALADSYRVYAQEHPGRFAATELRLDPETAIRSAGPRHSQLTRAILRGYELTDVDEMHAVRLFGSTVRGFIGLEMSGSFSHSSPDSDESWHRIIDALDATLRHWPAR